MTKPSCQLAELPDLYDVAPTYATAGMSEDFAELSRNPDYRLLRIGDRRVAVFRNANLRAIASNPLAGNQFVDAMLRREFAHESQEGAVAVDERLNMKRFLKPQIFASNPPRHGPVRQVLARQLMPKPIAVLAPIASATVERLIDDVSGAGEIDLGADFAERLTIGVWGSVYGISDVEQARLLSILRDITPLFFLVRTPAETHTLEKAMGECLDLVADAVHRAIAAGDNSVLESMKAEFGALAPGEDTENFGTWLASNIIDGFHTAALASSNVVYALLSAPHALAAVRSDATLAPKAVAEGLRVYSPILLTNRRALDDIEYERLRIPSGTPIAMLWAAGNRDPAVFENPNTYELNRTRRTPTTFGGGGHICPGRYAGALLSEVMVRSLINNEVEISLTCDRVTWLPRSFMRQAWRTPVTVRRIARGERKERIARSNGTGFSLAIEDGQ